MVVFTRLYTEARFKEQMAHFKYRNQEKFTVSQHTKITKKISRDNLKNLSKAQMHSNLTVFLVRELYNDITTKKDIFRFIFLVIHRLKNYFF